MGWAVSKYNNYLSYGTKYRWRQLHGSCGVRTKDETAPLLNMRRLKPELKGALLTLLGVALVFAGIWVFIDVRLRIWTYHEYDRYVWLTASLPVAHALWHHDVKAGEAVERLIATRHPHVTSRFGRWVEMKWVPGGPREGCGSLIGIWILANDGVVVAANSYADDGLLNRSFFDARTPIEMAEYRADFEAFVDALRDAGTNSRDSEADSHR